MQVHTLTYNTDLYEVVLDDGIIKRLSRYFSGSSMRDDVTFAECPVQVQSKIVQLIERDLLDEN